jgi:ribosomal protein L11 methylase PrmA
MDLYLATDNDSDNEVQSISMNELKGNSQSAHQFPNVSLLKDNQYDITIANILAPILIYLVFDLYKFIIYN